MHSVNRFLINARMTCIDYPILIDVRVSSPRLRPLPRLRRNALGNFSGPLSQQRNNVSIERKLSLYHGVRKQLRPLFSLI
jgi:hypothetical protein